MWEVWRSTASSYRLSKYPPTSRDPFLHTTTFGGNPVCSAAAIATLHVSFPAGQFGPIQSRDLVADGRAAFWQVRRTRGELNRGRPAVDAEDSWDLGCWPHESHRRFPPHELRLGRRGVRRAPLLGAVGQASRSTSLEPLRRGGTRSGHRGGS